MLRSGLQAPHEHMLGPDRAARSQLQACAEQMGGPSCGQRSTATSHHCRQSMYSHKVHQQVGVVHEVHLQQGSRGSVDLYGGHPVPLHSLSFTEQVLTGWLPAGSLSYMPTKWMDLSCPGCPSPSCSGSAACVGRPQSAACTAQDKCVVDMERCAFLQTSNRARHPHHPL